MTRRNNSMKVISNYGVITELITLKLILISKGLLALANFDQLDLITKWEIIDRGKRAKEFFKFNFYILLFIII